MITGENNMSKTEARGINGTGSGMQTAQTTRRIKDVGQRLIAGLRAGLMAFALMAGLLGVHAQAWAAVSLTAPAANSNYLQWSNVTLSADATAPGGTIARVDFYANNGTANTLIGTSSYPPYTLIWNAGVGGHYAMTAVATDNLGTQTTSTVTPINVVVPPTVNLTSPANNAVATSPASFTLSADASSLGSIAKVEFYYGGLLLSTATAAPYRYTWSNVTPGTYTLMAKATDTLGQSSYSSAVNVTSATPPVVSLTSPAANASVVAPGSFTLTANAWGTSSGLKSVAFYSGTTLLGTATNAPYTFIWNNVAAGSYSLTALATDNNNVTATSGAVAVTVAGTNQPPTVTLTSPTTNSNYIQWSNVSISANATSPLGSIAKVDFYANNGTSNILIGTSNYPPYNLIWNAGVGGHYTMTAVATDNLGAQTTSTTAAITVVTRPVVNLTSPVSNVAFASPASFTLSADASSLGTIAKVEFYSGGTLLATVTSAPYRYSWGNVTQGVYTLMAKATDTLGQSAYSSAVNVTSATPPVVSLTNPATNASVAAPGSFTLTANAWGTSSGLKSVSFYSGATLLGTATSAPYSYVWNNVAAGSYSLTAKATDNNNVTATSGAVAVTVAGGNQPPTVSLTSPATNATTSAPGSFTLTANATSTGSTIARVDFYQGTTLIGTATAAPYSFTWSNVPPGTYSITAKATDLLNVATTSTPVSVTVNAASVQAYYIHADQLDTPRTITDTGGVVVWQWDNSDPFGNNVPNENPGGAGQFTFNLRYPGQYFDKETGLHQNYFRDYDPALGGRYIESDPIGLAGGSFSTYAYAANNPLSFTDPQGKSLVGLAGAGIGAIIGAGTSTAAQLIQNGGNWSSVNLSNVGWSAATGGAAGFLLTTPIGTTLAGIAGIGAGTNLLNYGLTTSPSDYSAAGAGAAVASGAIGGLIGGRAPNPYMFIEPSPSLNDINLIAQMVGAKVLGMGGLGGLVGAYDYTKGAPQNQQLVCH